MLSPILQKARRICETQAAAATDLGGIEISRSRLVITIGLATITYNPAVTAIIMAAGDAKASIVRQAIEMLSSQGKRPLPLSGHVYVGLASVLLEQNDLAGALELVQVGLQVGHHPGHDRQRDTQSACRRH